MASSPVISGGGFIIPALPATEDFVPAFAFLVAPTLAQLPVLPDFVEAPDAADAVLFDAGLTVLRGAVPAARILAGTAAVVRMLSPAPPVSFTLKYPTCPNAGDLVGIV